MFEWCDMLCSLSVPSRREHSWGVRRVESTEGGGVAWIERLVWGAVREVRRCVCVGLRWAVSFTRRKVLGARKRAVLRDADGFAGDENLPASADIAAAVRLDDLARNQLTIRSSAADIGARSVTDSARNNSAHRNLTIVRGFPLQITRLNSENLKYLLHVFFATPRDIRALARDVELASGQLVVRHDGACDVECFSSTSVPCMKCVLRNFVIERDPFQNDYDDGIGAEQDGESDGG